MAFVYEMSKDLPPTDGVLEALSVFADATTELNHALVSVKQRTRAGGLDLDKLKLTSVNRRGVVPCIWAQLKAASTTQARGGHYDDTQHKRRDDV